MWAGGGWGGTLRKQEESPKEHYDEWQVLHTCPPFESCGSNGHIPLHFKTLQNAQKFRNKIIVTSVHVAEPRSTRLNHKGTEAYVSEQFAKYTTYSNNYTR